MLILSPLLYQGALGSSNASYEHQVRRALLTNYDMNVRPVIGKKPVYVAFGMKISRLVKVKWKNIFLAWDSAAYGNVSRVQFLPTEVWVPDISLFNNGDDRIPLAGGSTKFVTEISVDSGGYCVWSGPATFKANCDLQIVSWPFDNQTCELAFGSYTYGDDRLKIKLFVDKGGIFTDRFVTSGDWSITNIAKRVDKTTHGDCCPYDFSEVVFTLKMSRKPLFHLFYLTIPSTLLLALTLTSFFIPVESGERIGFVTTMLLAMTVFLLLIPSFLPETSDGVPILGISFQATSVIIALVLFSNIFVIKVFFMDGTPPQWVGRLCFCCRKKGKPSKRVHVNSSDEFPVPSMKSHPSLSTIELSTTSPKAATAHGWGEKEEQITWQKMSASLDHFFFTFFSIISVITICVIYLANK
ncbi:Neuronal acetylcholine receptor subunit alpha-7 [Stylophora pistillata]|uniref:Neuronal acetylcholine receptor subunit alpha-7 n=1 Tax=Stylophora pistillata TaxID=50429 RepID=A0A2B4RWG5_STYPI|nr:Neuronal acetylcholine receptor subunit alpha-7 [Stylophora pistillata]